jgi:ribonuclease Z
MEAKHILLTHFSQRYPKITNLNSAATATNTGALTQSTNETSNVALAFDGAAVPIGSLWKLSKYTPALGQLFAETAAVIGVPARANTQREGMASDSATDLRTATSGEREIPPIREKKKPKRIAER